MMELGILIGKTVDCIVISKTGCDPKTIQSTTSSQGAPEQHLLELSWERKIRHQSNIQKKVNYLEDSARLNHLTVALVPRKATNIKNQSDAGFNPSISGSEDQCR